MLAAVVALGAGALVGCPKERETAEVYGAPPAPKPSASTVPSSDASTK
jgi:hypothetical protein